MALKIANKQLYIFMDGYMWVTFILQRNLSGFVSIK